MSRVILLLLIGVLVVVIWRPARETLQPHVQFAFDPVYEWNTRNTVSELTGLVRHQQTLGRTMPRPDDFSEFVEREKGKGAAADPWGTPYYLLVTRRTYQVGSAGPDRLPETADDLVGEEVPRRDRTDRRP